MIRSFTVNVQCAHCTPPDRPMVTVKNEHGGIVHVHKDELAAYETAVRLKQIKSAEEAIRAAQATLDELKSRNLSNVIKDNIEFVVG